MKFFCKRFVLVALSIIFSMCMLSTVNAEDNMVREYSMQDDLSNIEGGNIEISVTEGKLSSNDEVVVDKNNLSEENIETSDKLSNENIKSNTQVEYLYGNDRYQTAVKISRSGWSNGSDYVVVVGGDNTLNGIIATPLASTFNAPILTTQSAYLNNDTSLELKRLKPKKIYLIGNTSSMSSKVESSIKSLSNAQIIRVSGSTSGEVSSKVANIIAANHKVDTAYIVSAANGVADALSIASKSGDTKNPVLVTGQNTINSSVLNFLKDNINKAYYIGGVNSISNAVISKVNSVVQSAGVNNRISGADRNETNAKVVNRFYKNLNLDNVVITKSENAGLIDTVSAGPFAASLKAPIIIVGRNNIASSTSGLLNMMKAKKMYQIGGGISSSITNSIKTKLQGKISNNNSNSGTIISPTPKKLSDNIISGGCIKGKTIVIDPGHGGKDTGAIGLNGNREKDWTLTTALACADYLTKAGANVIMTRKTDVYPTLQDRADISNNNNAVFFCSIHYNKGGDVINSSTGELSGTGVEVYTGDGNLAQKAGKKVLSSILEKFDMKSRGVKDGTHLYVIRNTNAPAILVEGGFISNSRDVSLVGSKEAQKTMGIQIAKGIISAFN